MNLLADLVAKGGAPIIAIMILSVVLYSRCFKLLLLLRCARRQLRLDQHHADAAALEEHRALAYQEFQQRRVSLAAMIAAAPLLGLLGTVSGMAKTFESLGSRAGEKSMEGLARGISEVLVATEAGLAVAIPAIVLVFLAHREVRRLAETSHQLQRCKAPAQ